MNNIGIIIAVPSKYEEICYENILNLRRMNCYLPIELWEIGQEISDEFRSKFLELKEVTIRNVAEFDSNLEHWKGFQVKAFMLYHTHFDTVFLIDADVTLFQNPEVLLQNENYITTGTYFFKDLDKWKFKKLNNKLVQLFQKVKYDSFTSQSFYLKRKAFFNTIFPQKPQNFPPEWMYLFENEIPKYPVKEALQESGVVLINKQIHKESVQYIYDLNNNHQETYQYIWGDKETFWMGCVMANKSFYFNPTPGYMDKQLKKLSHDYNGRLFFRQK
jgi:hypothetical protein